MNRVITLLILLPAFTGVSAQDWAFFQKGSKSIYYNGEDLYTFSIDTSKHNKGELITPNAELYLDSMLSCDSTFLETGFIPYLFSWFGTDAPLWSFTQTDSGVLMRDSVFLPGQLEPGLSRVQTFSYTTYMNIWTFSCDSVRSGSVLGMPDSIKYFRVELKEVKGSSTKVIFKDQFRWSKSYGIVDIPGHLNVGKARLMGYSTTNTSIGLVLPEPLDYFGKEVGQVSIYRHVTDNTPWYYHIEYSKDSVMHVQTDTSGIMWISRIETWENGALKRWLVDTTTVKMGEISYFSDAATYYPFSYSSVMTGPGSWVSYVRRQLNTTGNDTTFEFSFWDECIRKEKCFDQIPDCGISYRYDNRYGLISWSDAWYRKSELIGFRNSKETWGDFGLGVSVEEKQVLRLKIYPNPASGVLKIDNAPERMSYVIVSTDGRMVMEGNYSDDIDVSSLAPGMYYLKTSSAEGTMNGAFVKK